MVSTGLGRFELVKVQIPSARGEIESVSERGYRSDVLALRSLDRRSARSAYKPMLCLMRSRITRRMMTVMSFKNWSSVIWCSVSVGDGLVKLKESQVDGPLSV